MPTKQDIDTLKIVNETYPEMTMEEMLRVRANACRIIREKMSERGHNMPADDCDLIALIHRRQRTEAETVDDSRLPSDAVGPSDDRICD